MENANSPHSSNNQIGSSSNEKDDFRTNLRIQTTPSNYSPKDGNSPKEDNSQDETTFPRKRVSFQILKKYEEKKKSNPIKLKKEYASNITHQLVSPHQIKLLWEESPKQCFISYNPFNSEILQYLRKIIDYLHTKKHCIIIIEPQHHKDLRKDYPYLTTWDDKLARNDALNAVDLAICLGGDGTVLHCVKQFTQSCPPILGFGMGSIGFLTLFDVNNYEGILSKVLEKSIHISTRARLLCTIHRFDSDKNETFQVLNEIVCDRGPSPYLTSLDTFCNDKLITNVQADGLIVATPNGSSAYSMSAGGSIVHPSVPCILLTPICPHSLSFRPIILPDSAILKIQVPDSARASAYLSFDGANRKELRKGDSVSIQTSPWPTPLIVTNDATSAWFRDLSESFGWSRRKQQRPFS